VIIRTGAVTVSAKLSDLKLNTQQEKNQILQLTINRIGNISLYGDIVVEYLPAQGKPIKIGTIAGVGVYTNINKRDVTIKLNSTSGYKLSNGKLRVQYLSNGEPKQVVYAEGELNLM
jgi:hypothetical protein